MKKAIVIFLSLSLLLTTAGCNWTKKNSGTLIGAGTGAVIGGIIGNKTGSTAVGAILGAAVGGVMGAYIGKYMDKQAEEIERDLEGATVERIGEGIKITFDSGILFDVNKSHLHPAAVDNLTKLAVILNKYEDTEILVEGHTDSDGPAEYNLDLSMRRAQSVANQLTAQNVFATRINKNGYGEEQPVASNETKEGRQANRRVDIAIFANEKLKSEAEKKVYQGY